MGLCEAIGTAIPSSELTEAACSKGLLKQLKQKRFDLLLLALSHPGKNTIELLRTLKQKYPAMPVLVMCIYSESVYGYRALSNGASGYLMRETTVNDLVAAVKKILNGDSYISSSLAQNMLSKINTRAKVSSVELLSNRELQIAQLMASGKKANTIALETKLSVSTVGTYRKRIFNKLEMRTDAELIRFAIDNALV
jgi:DNA-binding NarL/FixJ family response regulator